MDRLLLSYVRIFFIVLFISEVLGNPTYYWSPQPDCYQANGYQQSEYQQPQYQPSSYQASEYQQQENQQSTYQEPNQQTNNERNDYQDQNGYVYDRPTGYQNSLTIPYQQQGPSYQETLQSMIDETIKALTEIVQVTVRASKQEISSLAKMFLDSIPKKFCNSENEAEYDPGEYNNGVEQYEEGHGNPSAENPLRPVRPLKGSLIEAVDLNNLSSTTMSPVPLSSSKPSLLSQSSTPFPATTVNTIDISKENMSTTPAISKDGTTANSSTIASTTPKEVSQMVKDMPLSISEDTFEPSNINLTSGTEHSMSLNFSEFQIPVTTQYPLGDKSNTTLTNTSIPTPPSKNESLSMTTVSDGSLVNSTMLEINSHNLSSSNNESVPISLNSTTQAPTGSDETSEQGSSLHSDETFSSTLPVNTQTTTTLIPTTLQQEVLSDSNMQYIPSAQSSVEKLQLNTTHSDSGNETTHSENSTAEISTFNTKPTTDKYEQDPDNDVDSDTVNFPRNPKL